MTEHVIYMQTGDPGDDGHGKSDTFRYTLTTDALQVDGGARKDIYTVLSNYLKDGMLATGIDLTGLCSEYGDNKIPSELADRIKTGLGVEIEGVEWPNHDGSVSVSPGEWAAAHAALIERGIVAAGYTATMARVYDPSGYFVDCDGYGLYE